ncbi:MAG TPA: phosphotransacetylase family protein [Anaerolineae bacterium]|nr:phosphotransacetylase family protein [Anaerolineae bacterium]
MKALYICSTTTFAGKTALCVGLGKRFKSDGFSVGYMKPLSTVARRIGGRIVDEDAQFIKQTLDLAEPLEVIAPIALMPQTVEDILAGEERADFAAQLKGAYAKVAQGKDVVLLEGGAHCMEGALVGLSAPLVADMLKARELVVAKYASDLVVDEVLGAKMLFGDSMIGAVINTVPRQRMRFVEEVIKPYLEEQGVKVFAVLPQDRLLMSISVGQLVDCLGGQVLCCPEACDELVEHLMVGAMTVDSALTYFRRKPNKAVITGGDRPDIQLAALETSTKCLILTGNLYPSSIILDRAEEVGVPVILVKQDTLTTVEIIEQFFGKTRLHQETKVHRFEKMLEERFDFDALYADLGLRAR